MPYAMSSREKQALEHLIRVAQGPTHQSRRVAEFLLAWWNAENCGGFDVTTAWGVDADIAADMVTVFALAVACHEYPHTLGYEKQFTAIVNAWRSELTT